MKFSDIKTREIHPAYRAVSLRGPARLPYKQALRQEIIFLGFACKKRNISSRLVSNTRVSSSIGSRSRK
jgi:hypothetical protein